MDDYGLEIMTKRAKEIGGWLKIESTPNYETQLIAQFPDSVISKSLLQKCKITRCAHLTMCKNENFAS